MPSEYMNNDDIDSEEDWVFVVLPFIKPEFERYCDIVSYMVPKVKELKAEGKISHWHFRFGGKEVSFRLRCGVNNRNEVFKMVERFAKKLRELGHVESYNMQQDLGWFFGDQWKKVNETSESRRNWWWGIERDELLSEIAYKVLTHAKPRDMVHSSLHNLLNMFCIQGYGQSYELQPRKLDDWSGILTDKSFEYLRYVVTCMKSNYAGKVIKLQKAIPKEMIEPLRAECESEWVKDWEKKALRMILFAQLL